MSKPAILQSVYPEPVLVYAGQIAEALAVPRDRVLWASALAVALQPPELPVAYPEMAEGTRRAITFTKGTREVTRHIAKVRFYGRHAWAVYFGMVERYEVLVGILRLFAPELAALELSLLSTFVEVTPCPIVPPVRAPSSRLPPDPNAPPKAKRNKGPRKPNPWGRGRKPGTRNKPKPPKREEPKG